MRREGLDLLVPGRHRLLQDRLHAGQNLLRRLGQRQIRGAHGIRAGPAGAVADPGLEARLAESNHHQRSEHVAGAGEEAWQGRDVDPEEARGVVRPRGAADHREGRRLRLEPDGRHDDVGDLVGLVQAGDGAG